MPTKLLREARTNPLVRALVVLLLVGVVGLAAFTADLIHVLSNRPPDPGPLLAAQDTCAVGTYDPNREILRLDGIGRGWYSPLGVVDAGQFDCVFRILEAPDRVTARMEATTAADGMVEDGWAGFQASWTKTEDRGLDVAIWVARR